MHTFIFVDACVTRAKTKKKRKRRQMRVFERDREERTEDREGEMMDGDNDHAMPAVNNGYMMDDSDMNYMTTVEGPDSNDEWDTVPEVVSSESEDEAAVQPIEVWSPPPPPANGDELEGLGGEGDEDEHEHDEVEHDEDVVAEVDELAGNVTVQGAARGEGDGGDDESDAEDYIDALDGVQVPIGQVLNGVRVGMEDDAVGEYEVEQKVRGMNVFSAETMQSVFTGLHDVMELAPSLENVEANATIEDTLRTIVAGSADDFIGQFLAHQLHHRGSTAGAAEALKFFKDNLEKMVRLCQFGLIKTLEQHLKRIFKTSVPKMSVNVCLQDKEDKSYKVFYENDKYPLKEMQNIAQFETKFEITIVNMSQLVELFKRTGDGHENPREVTLHCDGIKLSNSGQSSYTVYSLRFSGCHLVIPIAVCKLFDKQDFSDLFALRLVLQRILEAGLVPTTLIGDSPVRAKLCGLISCNGINGCRYCHAESEKIHFRSQHADDDEDDDRDEGDPTIGRARPRRKQDDPRVIRTPSRRGGPEGLTKRCWTEKTMHQDLRTKESWINCLSEIVKMKEEGVYDGRGYLGVKYYSPILELRELDIVRDVPAEVMHLIDLVRDEVAFR